MRLVFQDASVEGQLEKCIASEGKKMTLVADRISLGRDFFFSMLFIWSVFLRFLCVCMCVSFSTGAWSLGLEGKARKG